MYRVRVEAVVIGALYLPSRPQYAVESLVDYTEACVEEVVRLFPQALVILAGDFNQLSTNVIRERTCLTPLVHQPTRGANILDQILVSWPKYSKVHVLASLVSSDHKAIIAHGETARRAPVKTTTQRTFRKRLPTQHALFLQHVTTEAVDNPSPSSDMQTEFGLFYTKVLYLLYRFYPLRTVTVTSRDPHYITPEIKAKLRRKNKLMRAGRVEEAAAVAKRIAIDITKCNKTRLNHINIKKGSKDVWVAVREVTCQKICPNPQQPLCRNIW